VANYLRLLKLPAEIQKGLREKQITVGHAKALVNIEEEETQIMLFRQILRYDFSVRKIEEIVREFSNQSQAEKEQKNRETLPEHLLYIKERLNDIFPVPVKISANEEGKGKITISFRTENELREIVKIIENQK
jgi:ParB family chromosome partitioning protein